ncbi:hypothetical protein LAZ67_20000963, partial [Cordylochernes scorpioides]
MFSHVTQRSVTLPARIQPPETFDFSTPNEWPKWRKRFERYLVVSGMKKKEEADKIDLFMYLMGDRADDIFRTFKFEKEEEATKIDSVLKAFDSHFCVRKNIIYERAKFNSRIQEDREPVDEFITSLYKLADSCEFEGLHEQLIRDRIVVGVRDKALSERMQLDSELTLEKAVKMVRQQEAVRQQQVDLQRPSTSQKVNQVKFNSKKQSPKQQQQPSEKKEKLRNGNYEIKEKIYVIRRLSEPLLSRRACELLNLARRIEVIATRINPIKKFPEVFEGLGQIGNPYEIKLKPGAKPYAVHIPRRVPIPLTEKLKTRLDIPGKELLDADALSRQPLLATEGSEKERPTSAHINAVLSSLTDKDEMLTKIFEAQQEDTTLKAVVNYLEQGWPDKKKMSQALLSYWHVKDELGVQNGLLMRSCRLVIPASMKLEILDKLHDGHFGITKTRLRARETVWWPGISEEIAETVRKCSVCIQEAVSKHEPLIPTNFPTRPWQKIGMDLFKFENKWYLVVIDYYSRFPEMIQLDRLTANVVVRSCKSIFARHGIPKTVVSDNGTQFGAAREFANFARQYGFTHVTSSPRFPQSNGMAEAGVKIAKLILKKNQDPSLGLLEYRSTPLENGYSPAELLMGRKLRTTLPIAPENLNPRLVDSQTLKRKEGRRRKDMKSRYDRRCGATDMEELSEGDTVWITDMRTWGIVKQKASTPRSYMVDTPVGNLRRNRFHLRKGDTVQYPADPSTPTFSGEELVENEKTPVVDYPSNDSEDGQIRTRSGRIVKPRMPGHRKRRQFKQTDAFTRGMVIGLKRAGWSIRQIAADTHLGASTVHRLWRRWLEQGNVAIYRNVGATRVTSARVDRHILRQAVAAPQATCTAILQHVQDTLDHSISTRTISRRLVANGLHSCRPLRRLPLTPPNRRQRLEWCRARSTWMTEWHRVVFSDESRFCLSSDSRRVRVWRRRGERSDPAAIVERPTVRQRGIMVWGAIAYDSRSPLLRIQGTMTAQRYVDDVLRPVTLPYLQGVPNALYQQDNARPHTARISQQALKDVQMLPWPPYSPELSPIEHVWDIIGRRLHALPQPLSEDELWQMVEREWRAIPQDAIRTLIDSLPRRVAACIAVR